MHKQNMYWDCSYAKDNLWKLMVSCDTNVVASLRKDGENFTFNFSTNSLWVANHRLKAKSLSDAMKNVELVVREAYEKELVDFREKVKSLEAKLLCMRTSADEGARQLNSVINYLYRDAANYKIHNRCVINGLLSKEQQETILSCLDDGEFFLPQLVGMPEKRFDEWDEEDDHLFFEMDAGAFETTDKACDIQTTPDELTARFQARKDNWNVDECQV